MSSGPNQINRPAPRLNPIVTTIMPGRRALGERWRKVTIYPDPDTGHYLIDNEATEAPPENQPIMVPALGNISIDMADWMLERGRDRQSETVRRNGRMSEKEFYEETNRRWHEYMAEKAQWLLGRSVSGPGGWNQRERPR